MTFFSSMAWTLISFILFTALVAVISSWKTKGDDLESAEGYFLAGRGLPGIVIAGSLLLTNLSAEQLVGLNGQSWASNMGPIAWEVGSMFTLLALAYYFLPQYLKMGAMTIPSLMEVRYGKGTKTMFSLVIVVMYSILNLPVILYSGAVVFEQIFGISDILGMSKFQSVAVLCLIIGGLMVPFLGFAVLARQTGGEGILDGMRYIVQADPAKMNAVNAWNAAEPEVPWPLIITGMFFNNLYWWCTNQSFVQRALAAKSLKEGQKGAIFCGFLKCLGPLYLVIPGIIAFYLPSIQESIAVAGNKAIDFAYPALIAAIIPKPVMGFFAAVMFGAILSSFNSVLNSASTMFTLDLYRSAFKPDASDAHCVKVGKIYGTIAGCVSIVIAPFVMNAKGITTFLNSMSQFVSLPVLCTILGVFLFKRLPAYTPKIITIFHVVCYGAFLLIAPSYPGTDNPIHYLYAMAVLFPVELLIMWALNKYRPAEEYVPQDVGAVDLTPWKYRHVVSIIGLILAVAIYAVFSPLGIAA